VQRVVEVESKWSRERFKFTVSGYLHSLNSGNKLTSPTKDPCKNHSRVQKLLLPPPRTSIPKSFASTRSTLLSKSIAVPLADMVNMQVDSTPSTSAGPGASPSLQYALAEREMLNPSLLFLSTALEDLFADEPNKPLFGLPRAEDATAETMGDLSNPMVMKNYYNKLLPWKAMFTWLNHGHGMSVLLVSRSCSCNLDELIRTISNRIVPTRQFTHREFAVTLEGEVYLRYQSFKDAEEFKAEILRLNPSRFEIGPQYSARVSFNSLRITSCLHQPSDPAPLILRHRRNSPKTKKS
jgi:hypothetical protein